MPDADLPAILAAYRERDRLTGLGYSRDPQDVPRLLAAVEAALALHQMQAGYFPPSCTSCAAWDEEAEEMVSAFWPCPTYLAVSRALGEDGTS